MNKKSILFLGIAVVFLFLVNAVFGPINITKAANNPVTGYAWSDNIGWIQMNPAFGGVQVDDATGIFSGYAWSDNIGWINFAPTSGFPETPNEGAKLNLSTGQITGWIKALSASGTSPITSCPDGYTYNSSNGKCENNPVCPAGGSYVPSRDRCEAALTTTTKYRCSVNGTLYNDSGSCSANCTQTASCTSQQNTNYGRTYASANNTCNGSYLIEGTLSDFTCSGTCDDSFPFLGNGICSTFGYNQIGCKGAGWQGSSAIHYCSLTTTSYSCPLSGGSACSGPSTCTAPGTCTPETSTSCPAGYSQTGSVCTPIAGWDMCPPSRVLNQATDKCEVDPTIVPGSGGWDGWIKMNGVSANLGTGAFSGYAWGSDVVGWVSFSGTTMNPLAPAVTISASPNPINYNSASTLTWTSTNVDSCVASGDWSGSKATSGSESTDNLTSAKTYTITCTGPGGSAENSVTINVNPLVPFCGDGICNGSETSASCPQDCQAQGQGQGEDFNINNSNAIFVSLISGAPSVSTETTLTIEPLNSFAGDVSLSVESVSPSISGATFNFIDSSLNSSEYSSGTKFSVNAPAGTPSGLYTITIKGDGGGLIRTTNIQLNIEAVEPNWIEI